jgi:hypothetical protein
MRALSSKIRTEVSSCVNLLSESGVGDFHVSNICYASEMLTDIEENTLASSISLDQTLVSGNISSEMPTDVAGRINKP